MFSLRAQSVTSCAVGTSDSPIAPMLRSASLIISSRTTVNDHVPESAISSVPPCFVIYDHVNGGFRNAIHFGERCCCIFRTPDFRHLSRGELRLPAVFSV